MSEPDRSPLEPEDPDEFEIIFDDDDVSPPAPSGDRPSSAPPPKPVPETTIALDKDPRASPPAENSARATTPQEPKDQPDPDPAPTPESEAKVKSEPAPDSPPSASKKFSRIEIASLAGIAAIILIVLIVLGSSLISHIPFANRNEASRNPNVPAKGDLIGIAELAAYWRQPLPGDRVKSGQALIPEVRVRLQDPTGTLPATGYLRFLIRDENDKIRGDVATEQVSNGLFASSGTSEVAVFGTEGFSQEIQLTSYAMEGKDRWTIEILEGATYGGKDWKRLAYFSLPSKRLKKGSE